MRPQVGGTMTSRMGDCVVQLLGLLAVLSLTLPLIGPAIDHDFAERQPAHGHVYLGAVNPDHAHSYELDQPAGSPAASRDQITSDSIIFLSTYEGAVQGVPALVNPFFLVDDLVFQSDDDGHSYGTPRNSDRPAEAALTPPSPPPRA